jgi:hypothetical protein
MTNRAAVLAALLASAARVPILAGGSSSPPGRSCLGTTLPPHQLGRAPLASRHMPGIFPDAERYLASLPCQPPAAPHGAWAHPG